MFRQREDYDVAVSIYDKAIELAYKDKTEEFTLAWSLQAKGRALIQLKKFGEATTCLMQSLAIYRKHATDKSWRPYLNDAYYELLRALIYQRNFDEAKIILEQALSQKILKKQNRCLIFSIFGDYLFGASQFEESLEMFKKALDVDTSNKESMGEILLGVGKCLYQLDKYEESKPFI